MTAITRIKIDCFTKSRAYFRGEDAFWKKPTLDCACLKGKRRGTDWP